MHTWSEMHLYIFEQNKHDDNTQSPIKASQNLLGKTHTQKNKVQKLMAYAIYYTPNFQKHTYIPQLIWFWHVIRRRKDTDKICGKSV